MKGRLIGMLAVLCLALSGCVTSGTYHQKELEAEGLTRNLQEQQTAYGKLQEENTQLKKDVERLKGELSAMTGERDALAASKKALEESLKTTSDSKNRRIGELSQQVTDLQEENKKLKDERTQLQAQLTQVQKQKEIEVQKTSKTYEDLLEHMKSEISKGEVTISELKGKLTVNMVEAVLFDSGHAEVKPEGLEVLQKVVDILKNIKDKSIRIEGHTDNIPIVGGLAKRYPSNWELSAARAINVTKYLQQQGIDPSLLAAVAYGQYKPVAPNDTDEGRAKNRRIEIVLVTKE